MARPRTLGPRHALAPIVAALMCVACGPPPGTVDRGGAPSPKAPTVDPTAPPRPPMVTPGPRLSRDVAPTAYALVLDVDPDQPMFHGEVTIDVAITVATEQLWLHAVFLEIDDAVIEIGGVRETLAVTARDGLIGLDLGRPVQGAARLTLRYRGWASPTDPVGLFTQTTDGASYLFSQLESMYARRVLPCFDEPGWKVPWQVTLVVPPGLIAASNTPEVARAPRADGKVAIRFATTPPMPSYLLAIAVGPFDVVEVGPLGRARVPARVLVAAGRGADAAVAVAETPRIVDALEAYLDRPLPLPSSTAWRCRRSRARWRTPG